jgi:flagellar basal-body rod protein FlgG
MSTMMRALFTSASGMVAQQLHVDVTANNLANVNTNGFRRMRADFADLFYQVGRNPGATVTGTQRVPSGVQVGVGVRPMATSRDMYTLGNIQETGQPLDMSIMGQGFYVIQRPDGTQAYTRDGSFHLTANSELVTGDGLYTVPQIVFPANIDQNQISVGSDGQVTVSDATGAIQQVGQIQLARFVNPEGLRAMGGNLFAETEASGQAITGIPGQDGLGEIQQRFLENSNVQVVNEMVALIVGQRAYEANSNGIQTADSMLSTANQVRR